MTGRPEHLDRGVDRPRPFTGDGLCAEIAPYVFVRSATVTVAVTRGSWASAFFTGF